MESQEPIKDILLKSAKMVKIIGWLVLLLGVFAIIYPASSGKIATIAIGVFLIISGLFRFAFAFLSPSMGTALLRYLFAILMIAAGGWTIGNPEMGLEAMTAVMAIFFIVDGLTELAYSFSLIPIGGGFYFLFSGILTLVLGILIFQKWPESSNYALGIYLGIKLVADGLSFLLTAWSIQKGSQLIES